MRVAVITKIFPSSLEPLSAPFNRQQIAELGRLCDVSVLAAVPHLPLSRALGVPARAARLALLPHRERIHGVDVTYLRQLYLPRIGLAVAVPLYLASLLPHRRLLRPVDVVLATWAYPDGCAAVVAARALGKPCVVKVHGSDVNVVLKRRAARRLAEHLLPRADAVIAVSRPLADEIVRLGVSRERVHVVRNGVDTSLFRPRDRSEARRALGVADDARLLLFVGRLEPRKGIGELLPAFARLRQRVPRAMLALIGEGESASRAHAFAASCGEDVVRVLGARPQEEVATWMAACDVFTLPSWDEGMPNVVFEALASGRPVVATAVGGIPDAVCDRRAGILVTPKDEGAVESALSAALCHTWDEAAIRACGPRPWAESGAALHGVLTRACEARSSSGAAGRPSETPQKRLALL